MCVIPRSNPRDFLVCAINKGMATPYTSNNGSTFYNINDCRSFAQPISNSLVALSAQPCSEIVVVNKGVAAIELYDNGYSSITNALVLSAGDTFTLRGLTNSAVVSAKTGSGTSTLYYRTQYFSFLPQR